MNIEALKEKAVEIRRLYEKKDVAEGKRISDANDLVIPNFNEILD